MGVAGRVYKTAVKSLPRGPRASTASGPEPRPLPGAPRRGDRLPPFTVCLASPHCRWESPLLRSYIARNAASWGKRKKSLFPANGIEDGHTHSFSGFYISFKKPAQSELKSSILNSVYLGRAGVFQVAERLQKRICALCPKDLECSVLYFAQSENIAAHENCLLYSSALVECEDCDPSNNDRNFDVESVKKEIKRGRKLKCTFCGKKGATVGCDLKSCFKNYHFFCAKNDHAVLQADGHRGIYKVFCQQHAVPQNDLPLMKPLPGVFHSHYSEQTKPRHGVKRKRGRRKRHHVQDPNVGRHTKAAAAVQNAVQCCAVACDEKQRAPIQTTLDRFLKRVDRIEPSKEPEPVPSTSGVSEAAACPHLLLLPTLQL